MTEDQRANIRAEVLDALVSAGRPMTPRELSDKALSAERTDELAAVLRELVRNGEVQASDAEGMRRYELAITVEHERHGIPTTHLPSIDDDATRFALWSDGVLSIKTRAGGIELSADECELLMGYLIKAGVLAKTETDA